MPLQDDYQVRLSNFEGPLDLLLFLIRRAEVDIQDIPIVEITEQYFDFLKQIDEIDIELAGEFLVMAATLIEIKSRSIRPPPLPVVRCGSAGRTARPSWRSRARRSRPEGRTRCFARGAAAGPSRRSPSLRRTCGRAPARPSGARRFVDG